MKSVTYTAVSGKTYTMEQWVGDEEGSVPGLYVWYLEGKPVGTYFCDKDMNITTHGEMFNRAAGSL